MAGQDNNSLSWFADGRNLLIVILALVATFQAFWIFHQRPERSIPDIEKPNAMIHAGPERSPTQEVAVVGVTVEPELRRYILLAFDKPVGEDHVGQIPNRIPAEFSPAVPGTWTWISPFALRFDAVNPLPVDTVFHLGLVPDHFLHPGLVMAGDTSFTLRTGRFEISRVKLDEEPAPEGGALVLVIGRIEFTSPVDPADLASRLKLTDSNGEVDIPVAVTSTWAGQWMNFRSGPVLKGPEPRRLTLTVAPDMPSVLSGAELGRVWSHPVAVVLDSRLRVTRAWAESGLDHSSLKLELSTPVTTDVLASFLTIEPKTAWKASALGREISLNGNFQPGRSYELTVAKGLAAADGAVLPEQFVQRIDFPAIEPSADFIHQGMFLSRQGLRTLEL
ncbi:MAG: hypothetical protein EOM25_05655, partial [Deltaproteobacteria bacterium]|nr:hypothetical protein [Deltaproteobacteria bacterium]